MDQLTAERAHAHYLFALERVAALAPGGAAERVGPWLCIDAGLGVSKFNIAAVVEPVGSPRAALREAMAWFAARGINLRLDLRGRADGALLAASMVEGFSFWWREPAMLLEPLPRHLLEVPARGVLPVTSDETLALYCAADAEEYSDEEFQRGMAEQAIRLDGVSLYVAVDEGRPVGRSMAVVRDGLVGVHNVYVAPSQRRRGFGGALTVAALQAGHRAGALAACLEATVDGFPLYESLGFRRFDDYVVVGVETPPDSWAS